MRLFSVKAWIAAALGAAWAVSAAETTNSFPLLSLPSLGPATEILANGKPLTVGHTACPVVLDWNNDGKLDLLVGTFASGRVFLFLNQGATNEPVFAKGEPLRAGGRAIQVGYG